MNERTVKCRDCGAEISFLRPSAPNAKSIPIDPGGEETYRGTDRPVNMSPPPSRIRLATVDHGGFDFWLITAAQARELKIGYFAIMACSVHVCPERERRQPLRTA